MQQAQDASADAAMTENDEIISKVPALHLSSTRFYL